MGKTFKDLLAGDESLFRDHLVFDPQYVPESYIHRNAQVEAIAAAIRPGLKGSRPINALIYGPPATGKTTAIQKLAEQLGEIPEGGRVVLAHINCQIHTSRFAIFSQIHEQVVGHLPPETGVPFKRVYEAIFKRLIKDGRCLIAVLDDMNYLFFDRHANEIMYDILRAHEVYPGARTGLFGIVSDTEFNYKIDDKVRSMFQPREIFFPPYQIYDILKNRCTLGFSPGVISDELVERAAEVAYERGDLRLGIELLRRAALAAEAEGLRRIEPRHIEEALGPAKTTGLGSMIDTLSREEKRLLEVLAGLDEETVDSGRLYESYKEASGESYTTFYRVLEKLEAIRLLDATYSGRGKKGRTRNITLRFGKEEILSHL
ncbi:MAG: ORC1-type DNA replication protein [Euryarchaeota archaeon]|nr:ORC1-type DNA replication protein [Euryarchaeota archaeon]